MEKNVVLSDEMKSSISETGSRVAKWFQVSIEIRLFGVTIFKKTFPPDEEMKSSNS